VFSRHSIVYISLNIVLLLSATDRGASVM